MKEDIINIKGLIFLEFSRSGSVFDSYLIPIKIRNAQIIKLNKKVIQLCGTIWHTFKTATMIERIETAVKTNTNDRSRVTFNFSKNFIIHLYF